MRATLAVFAAAFAAFLGCLYPAIAPRDSADLAATALTLGVAHPPGYPLFSVLGHAWLTAFPLGNTAYRLNLLSALAGAAAAAALFALARRRAGILGGLTAAALWSLSAPLWKFSLLAESYSLQALFAAVLLLLAEGDDESVFVRARTSGFILGLGLVNHQSLLFIVPGLLWLWRAEAARSRVSAARLLTAAGLPLLAGLSFYAFLWVRLEGLLGLVPQATGLTHNSNYGLPGWPAFRWGYELARQTRERLGLGDEPIPSLRALAEERLGIPIIQAELGTEIAGATLEVGQRRAIIVNLSGSNRNVYIRRSTIAHELGHILFDPTERLKDLRVDEYQDLEAAAERRQDPVEQRANAFAVELIAPQKVAVERYQTSEAPDRLGEVMEHFGLSFTAARYQVWNGLDRCIAMDSLTSSARVAPQRWDAAEAFTVDYHPLRRLRPSRAGRFSAVVVRAAEEGLITWDTAAVYLETSEVAEVQAVAGEVRELFPRVWD